MSATSASGRAATFLTSTSDDASDSSSSEVTLEREPRRAAYRPRRETSSETETSLNEIREGLAFDLAHLNNDPTQWAKTALSIARIDEILGACQRAQRTIDDIKSTVTDSQIRDEAETIERRLARAEGQGPDELFELTEQHLQETDAENAELLELEHVRLGWDAGRDVEHLLSILSDTPESTATEMGDYYKVWRLQLLVDILLESDDVDRALEHLEGESQAIGDTSLSRLLKSRLGVWLNLRGSTNRAREVLKSVQQGEGLPGDLLDFAFSLELEAGDRRAAREMIRGLEPEMIQDPGFVITAAAMLRDNEDRGLALDFLDESSSESDYLKRHTLRLKEEIFENQRFELNEGLTAGLDSDLIDVLNEQLEYADSQQKEVSTLCRLGRLYETEANLSEAAAEVYREALSKDPSCRRAFESLERLYRKNDNWEQLAALYEDRIDESEGDSWHLCFKLAQIYRQQLGDPQKALDWYRAVLSEKPGYLPAVDEAAALFRNSGQWGGLAELYEKAAESLQSRCKRRYYLSKVAHIAEERLDDDGYAIRVWQRMLSFDEGHPDAYGALRRLYARNEHWSELIQINEQAAEQLSHRAEVANLYFRNGELRKRKLKDVDSAELWYSRALEVDPTFRPALDALETLYIQRGDWSSYMNMINRELRALDTPGRALERLEELGELFEYHYDLPEKAISVYEKIRELDPEHHLAGRALERLYRLDADWQKLRGLLEERAESASQMREASIRGRLGELLEWRLEHLSAAFQAYQRALELEPGNRAWLDGISRTWAASSSNAEAVADFLEDSLMASMDGEVRDRYFKIISRLRERALRSPEASRAHRTHGANDSIENQIVLQFALARAGERAELSQMRNMIPRHCLERLADLPRTQLSSEDMDDLVKSLPELKRCEKDFVIGELDVETELDDLIDVVDKDRHLSEDLKRIRQERPFVPLSGDKSRLLFRLRAINARRHGDLNGYKKWTMKELQLSDNRELHVLRRIELANYITERSLAEGSSQLLTRAAEIAFPERSNDIDESTDVVRKSCRRLHRKTLETLYDGLKQHQQWHLLESVLRADVARGEIEESTHLDLQRRRSRILEEELKRYGEAEEALLECWEISENPDFLEDLVRIGLELEEPERATQFQKEHFHYLTSHPEYDVRECLHSGLRLAERFLANPEVSREHAIEHMETILSNYDGKTDVSELKERLAHTYADSGRGGRAIELFEDILQPPVSEQMYDEWCRLVDVYCGLQGNPEKAYRLQWKIVKAFPSEMELVEDLIRLARKAGALEECAEELEVLTDSLEGESRTALLIRTAELIDEELHRPERALELYQRAMEEVSKESYLYREALRKRAFSLSRQTGCQKAAVEAFQSLIEVEPFEPSNYRGLKNILSQRNNTARERIAGQILSTLNCNTRLEEVRQKTIPSRAFGDEIVEELLATERLVEEADLLRSLAPLASKAHERKLPQLKALEGVTVGEDDYPDLYRGIQNGLNAFGLHRFKLLIGEAGPMRPQIFGAGKKGIWLNSDLVRGLSRSQKHFLGGYIGALAWLNLENMDQLEGQGIWNLISGIYYCQYQTSLTQNGRVTNRVEEISRAVSSPFNAMARYRILQEIEESRAHIVERDWTCWPKSIRRFAARSGLVMSGDVEASVDTMLGMRDWGAPLQSMRTQQHLTRNEIVEDLFKFAVKDEFLHARYTIGLSGQPKLKAG